MYIFYFYAGKDLAAISSDKLNVVVSLQLHIFWFIV